MNSDKAKGSLLKLAISVLYASVFLVLGIAVLYAGVFLAAAAIFFNS